MSDGETRPPGNCSNPALTVAAEFGVYPFEARKECNRPSSSIGLGQRSASRLAVVPRGWPSGRRRWDVQAHLGRTGRPVSVEWICVGLGTWLWPCEHIT